MTPEDLEQARKDMIEAVKLAKLIESVCDQCDQCKLTHSLTHHTGSIPRKCAAASRQGRCSTGSPPAVRACEGREVPRHQGPERTSELQEGGDGVRRWQGQG